MEQLSSGKRINSAADDAAGLSIATRMESQVRGLNQAMRNAADGQSMVDTAEGAMDEMTNMLQRMRELSLQAANGSNNDVDRSALNSEVDQLKAEIDRIVSTTTFNGKSLLDGEMNSTLQIGVNAGETLDFEIANMGTASLGAISGAPASQGVTSASFEGKEAVATVSQMTFNGNDSYNFKLKLDLGNTSGANNESGFDTFDITADVSAGSAADVAAKINAAIRDVSLAADGGQEAPDNAARYVRASAANNVVTIENLYGGDISVGLLDDGSHISNSGGTIDFSSVVKDTSTSNPSDNTLLGSNANIRTTFANDGGNAADGFAGVIEKQVVDSSDFDAAAASGSNSGEYRMHVGDQYIDFADPAPTGYADGDALATAILSGAASTGQSGSQLLTELGISLTPDALAGPNVTFEWDAAGSQSAITFSNVFTAQETDAVEDSGEDRVVPDAAYETVKFGSIAGLLEAKTYSFSFTEGVSAVDALEVSMSGQLSVAKLANLLNSEAAAWETANDKTYRYEFSEADDGSLLATSKMALPTAGDAAVEQTGRGAATLHKLTMGTTDAEASAALTDFTTADLTVNTNSYTVSVDNRGSAVTLSGFTASANDEVGLQELADEFNDHSTFQSLGLTASLNSANALVVTSDTGGAETIVIQIGGVDASTYSLDSDGGEPVNMVIDLGSDAADLVGEDDSFTLQRRRERNSVFGYCRRIFCRDEWQCGYDFFRWPDANR